MITVFDIMAWDPCDDYPEKRIRDLVGDGITPQGIHDLDISVDDKIWCLLHEHQDLFTEMQLHSLACDFAEQALSLIDNPDERSKAAITIKSLWIEGKANDKELAAARAAARDIARDAAWTAARAAARAAQLKHIMKMLATQPTRSLYPGRK